MKQKFGIPIIFILCLSLSMSAYAATSAELRKQQQQAQEQMNSTKQQLEEANSEISDLTEVQKGITDEIAVIDDQLVEVLASVSIIEDEIDDIQDQIAQAKIDLAAAQQVQEEQYESMKTRIKYMYEKGEMQYVQLLLESKNTADFVNKVDYVDQLYTYDREKLEEYIAAKEAVEAAKQALEEEEEELETSRYELELEQEELNTMLDEKKAEEADYESQISKAKQEAAAYKAQIKQQNAEIRKLEAAATKQEEAEAAAAAALAAKQAAAQNATTEGTDEESGSDTSSSSDDSSSSTASSETGSTSTVSSSGSATGQAIANYACQFVGNPYVAGGTSLTNGADCSGFTMAVYQAFGYSIPRTSTAQRSAGVGVTYAEAQPGDIICYAGHVAIYLGNGRIVHASTPSSGIKYGSATYKEILAVRRIVN